MKNRLFILIPILLLLGFACNAREIKEVLVISPYSTNSSWAHTMMRPIIELEQARSDIRVYHSILSITSIDDVNDYDEKAEAILDLLDDKRPDLVILGGPGLYRIVDNIYQRWDDVPVLLTGELDYVCTKEYTLDTKADRDTERIPVEEYIKGKNCTLLMTPTHVDKCIDLIKTMVPDVNNLYFIGGEDYLSREIQIRTEDYLLTSHPEIKFSPLLISDMTDFDVIDSVSNIDLKTEAVIYCNWHKHLGSSEAAIPQRGIRKILGSYAPIFDFFITDFTSDHGQVGYSAYDFSQYEEAFRDIIRDILDNGIQAKDIPFKTFEPCEPVLNWNAMHHYNFDMGLAPKDAIIVNRPPSFWEDNHYSILTALVIAFIVVLIIFLVLVFFHSERNKKKAEKAQKQSTMKSLFIQNMSHDVRTPINAIVGFAQLLGLPDGFLTEEEKAQYNSYIMNNANMLLMLVDDILNISYVESGVYRIEKGDANCNEIMNTCMKCTETRAKAGVRMYVTSEVDNNYTLYTDGKRVQQILINFLTNACKHTESGEIRIHCSLSENPGSVTFSVTDTGTGIPPEQAQVIFDRFTKLNDNIEGTGIGLNICNTLSQRLGGSVSLDTSYTNGARFTLLLPLEQ